MTVSGFASPGWTSLVDAFRQQPSGAGPGAFALAIHHHGELVVDIWGGTDPVSQRPWERDSVGLIFSCTKAVSTAVLLRSVADGSLDLDAPVASYWPEFAACGKESITPRHVLTHTAGVPFVGTDDPAVLLDPRAAAASIAAGPAVSGPGAHWQYHALSVGYLANELSIRVSGRSIGRRWAQLARERDLDLWIGFDADLDDRFRPSHLLEPIPTADLAAMRVPQADRLQEAARRTTVEVLTLFYGHDRDGIPLMNTPAFRRSEIPAGGGVASARGLAGFYRELIDPHDPLIPVEVLREALICRTDDTTAIPPDTVPHRYGSGLDLPNPNNPMLGGDSFGHSGAGGRLGFASPEHQLAVGYVCTGMGVGEPDPRWTPILSHLQQAFGS